MTRRKSQQKNESVTFPFTRWKEKVKDHIRYNRQENKKITEREIEDE